ncbi:GTPase HflX [Lentzea sp. DG1S-22]|uniref:GTPase HflX n=1 Tax=Lentzea sp. DG1S-22 TaxID=3108822 RepID=UPI002E76FFE4|nr:GTPase HflX [Lentzea sp. DG1S-22]WVH82025.1 GTPase HflX [Lentzea sp. DG1S-22]
MAGAWLLGEDGERTAAPRAVLVAVQRDRAAGASGTELSLAELRRLADTDGLEVVDTVVQSREGPDPATYVGSGKTGELASAAQQARADLIIADGELTGRQAHTLEERTGVRVVDRTALILDIFAQHARSSEGRLQVELAQIAYQLPRLRGQGEALSRVGGGRVAGGAGIGVRGPGEMRLETQRRTLRRRATELRRRVAALTRRRQRTRDRRARNRVPSVAIIGYTNAGKSALLNRLSGAEVSSADVLFATLDPTVRRISADQATFTLTDTVGFIRHLPHQLVDAFESTLEEVRQADLVLHVVDASAPDALGQITTVHGVLHEIGAGDVPEQLVLNKTDIAPAEWVSALCRCHPDAIGVSALTGDQVTALRTRLVDWAREHTY